MDHATMPDHWSFRAKSMKRHALALRGLEPETSRTVRVHLPDGSTVFDTVHAWYCVRDTCAEYYWSLWAAADTMAKKYGPGISVSFPQVHA